MKRFSIKNYEYKFAQLNNELKNLTQSNFLILCYLLMSTKLVTLPLNPLTQTIFWWSLDWQSCNQMSYL